MDKTYLQYGIDSELAFKLKSKRLPKTTFERVSNKKLKLTYDLTDEEILIVKDAIKRKPIDPDTLDALLERSNYTCCVCKGVKGDSYIIHHIEEYHLSQDNSYENLAVLCPNDHDLAHKSGKSLTKKISKESLIKLKNAWEKQVESYNVNKASKTGNIFEVDFLNVPRILELYLEIFGDIPDTKYSEELTKQRLLTALGNINIDVTSTFAQNPNTPLIFYALYGSAMLRQHFFETFKAILKRVTFIDLDSLLNRKSVKAGIIGEYCYYVGGLYSTTLPSEITQNSGPMKFYFKRKVFKVEWLVDPQYFASSSAKWRTGNRCVYMIYGKIRNVAIQAIDGTEMLVVDIRPYCFGLPEERKYRTPVIAYRDEFDKLFDDFE